MSAKQFTFKDHNPTGRWRSFERMYSDIKLNGRVCGGIYEFEGFNKWEVRFMIHRDADKITKESPCPFRWVTLKWKPTSKEEAKTVLKRDTEKITKGLNLYFRERE